MKEDTMKKEFTDLYNQEADALFRYCYFRVSDREEARDIVQQSFTKLWDILQRGKSDIKSLHSFLFKIAANLVIDWYRKKKPVSLDTILDSDNKEESLHLVDTSYEDMEIQSDGKIFLNTISTLDPTYQQVVYLRYVEDMSPKEIAKILNLTPNVVSVRITRGIEILKKKYEK